MARTVVVGAGIGGLAAAVELAALGARVTILERQAAVGGKMREVLVGGRAVDSGPTVLTLRPVFEDLFSAAGGRLSDHVRLSPLTVLARHAWTDGARLDLFSDRERSTQAIRAAFGAVEADGYVRFSAYARRIWDTVRGPFVHGPRLGVVGLIGALGVRGLHAAARIDFRRTVWEALQEYFREPRLRQLFARYATYYGSDPFHAPATLNLIAHVESEGVWVVEGGMSRLAQALAGLAERLGAELRCGVSASEVVVARGCVREVVTATGERLPAEAVVLNVEPAAIAAGHLGPGVAPAVAAPDRRQRSLSAVTWSMLARTEGFPLLHHNVFFSPDYAREFCELGRERRIPRTPTVYVCAQDVAAAEVEGRPDGEGRLFVLVNAPSAGDAPVPPGDAAELVWTRTAEQLGRCGMSVRLLAAAVPTTPTDFERLFPGTGGALYGPATHGWRAAFSRPGSRTKVRGLYLAGGGAHPGAGVPLVAISGRLAAAAAAEDLRLTPRSSAAGIAGGTSTR